MTAVKSILKFLLNVAIYVAIVAAIVWGAPKFLSWKLGTEYPIAAITSGSMWPGLKAGDMVLIKAVAQPELEVGDIIVWKNPDGQGFTIHRVVKLNDTTVVTKGDANFEPDKPVPYEDVVGRTLTFRGKQVRIPFIGYVTINASKYVR